MSSGVRRVAAIDCGTNTIRLLIADAAEQDGNVRLADVLRTMHTVRLGEGVDTSGVLSVAALTRADAALHEIAGQIAEHRADPVRMVATSATRDAQNRDDFYAMVRRHLRVEPEVISGDEEAALSFAGVLAGLEVAERTLVIDIGGGSTEFILGAGPGQPAGVSTNIGVVRLTERHLHHDPAEPAEVAAVAADARAAVDQAAAAIGSLRGVPVVGVAGTVTTTVGIALGLDGYDRAAIHGATVPRAAVTDVRRWALGSTLDERLAHPVMHPGRAAVFPAGSIILDEILAATGADAVTASETDILDGIALSILD